MRRPTHTMMGLPAVLEQDSSGEEESEPGTAKQTLFGLPALNLDQGADGASPGPEVEARTTEISAADVQRAIQHAAMSRQPQVPVQEESPADSTREVSANELAMALGRDRLGKPPARADDDGPAVGPPPLKNSAKQTAFGIPVPPELPSAKAVSPVRVTPDPVIEEPEPAKSRSTMFGLPQVPVEEEEVEEKIGEQESPVAEKEAGSTSLVESLASEDKRRKLLDKVRALRKDPPSEGAPKLAVPEPKGRGETPASGVFKVSRRDKAGQERAGEEPVGQGQPVDENVDRLENDEGGGQVDREYSQQPGTTDGPP
ncbi:MAG: hypothetical protein ACNA8W_15025, partial [Bradymonadaceae bacterium]